MTCFQNIFWWSIMKYSVVLLHSQLKTLMLTAAKSCGLYPYSSIKPD